MEIKKMKYFLKKNNLLIKILLSYVIIGIILISIFSYTLVNAFSRSNMKDINHINEEKIFQSYNTADILLTSTYNYFYKLYTSEPIIFNALYSKTFSPLDMGEIGKKLRDIVFSNPLVYSVYIYNLQAGLIFTNVSTTHTIEEFFDRDAIKLIKEYSLISNEIFIPRKVTYKILDKTENIDFISVLFMEVSGNKEPDAVMVLNINQRVLQEMVTDKSAETNSIFIINNNGIIISCADSSLINKKINNEEYIKKILLSKEKKGNFTYKINGKESLITYVKSDRLGWSFIGLIDYKKLISKITTLQKYGLIITIIFILIGIIIAVFFVRNIYTPLYRLLRKIRSGSKEDQELLFLNEYEYLSNTFNQLVANVYELKTYINQYIPANKKEVIKKIIHGEINYSEEYKKNVDKYNIRLKSEYFIVVIIKIDSFKEMQEKFSMEDIALFRLAISNIASELLGVEFESEVFEDETDHIVLIINVNNTEDSPVLRKITDILFFIQSNIEKNFKFTVTASIGNIVNNIEDIKYCYKNALTASNYRFIYGKNSIIQYNDTIKLTDENYNYPFDIEKLIMNSLKLGDKKELYINMDEFFKFIKQFSYEEILLSLNQLILTSVRTAEAMIDFSKDNINPYHEIIHKKLDEYDTLEEVKTWLISLYAHIMDIRSRKPERKWEETINELKCYINKNFQEPNLSVETIADIVHLSPNFIRNIFKENANQSISSYIAEVRFEKAQELLRTTRYSAKEIAKMVGFSESRYFYTAFKKFFGKTPDQYRRESINWNADN